MSTVRVVGDPHQRCERIGMLVGSIGGDRQISLVVHFDDASSAASTLAVLAHSAELLSLVSVSLFSSHPFFTQ